jgi:hypothetical protein
MMKFLLFSLLTLLAFQQNASAATALPLAIQEGSLLTDDAIDQVGEQVMGGNEFRSVRRRVLEQLPEVDVDKGFLGIRAGMGR